MFYHTKEFSKIGTWMFSKSICPGESHILKIMHFYFFFSLLLSLLTLVSADFVFHSQKFLITSCDGLTHAVIISCVFNVERAQNEG